MLIYQTHIPSNDYYLFACIYSEEKYDNIAILFPGYTHSKSDMDYILSNLRNHLLSLNYLVIQVDFYGHGDSYGEFCDCSIEILKENICNSILWAKNEFRKNIVTFSRGIIGNLIGEIQICNKTINIILNPVYLFEENINFIKNILGKDFQSDIVDFHNYSNLFNNHDRKMLINYIYALGAESRNILGMKINLKTLLDMLFLASNIHTNKHNIIFIFSNNTQNIEIGSHKMHSLTYYEKAFVREPEWNDLIIKSIINCLERK